VTRGHRTGWTASSSRLPLRPTACASTWPSYISCGRHVIENDATYATRRNVNGFAAWSRARRPDRKYGIRDPERSRGSSRRALISCHADGCPAGSIRGSRREQRRTQQCTGGREYNGLYGFGQVNALAAVTGRLDRAARPGLTRTITGGRLLELNAPRPSGSPPGLVQLVEPFPHSRAHG